jgi:sporulation protein YunB
MAHLGRKLLRWGVLIATISVAGVMLFRWKYNDPIRELSHTQIMNATSDLINDAIDHQIENGDIHYDRIVYFEKDLTGRITALRTNMSEVNRLKTDTLNIINDEILALDSSDLGIPLGSLFLPEFLSGRGPQIPVQIISIRNSDASFQSKFSHAGINQTLHQITMSVLVDVTVLVLGQTERFQVASEVVVAETIIVGDVPDTFFQTGGLYGPETKDSGAY